MRGALSAFSNRMEVWLLSSWLMSSQVMSKRLLDYSPVQRNNLHSTVYTSTQEIFVLKKYFQLMGGIIKNICLPSGHFSDRDVCCRIGNEIQSNFHHSSMRRIFPVSSCCIMLTCTEKSLHNEEVKMCKKRSSYQKYSKELQLSIVSEYLSGGISKYALCKNIISRVVRV